MTQICLLLIGGADWLLDNEVGVGTIIDCVVRFGYSQAPVGDKGKMVNKISLIFEEGLSVVGKDEEYGSDLGSNTLDFFRFLENFQK